ncbi:hypothetical protein EDD86DRAFT_204243 [Gorgonomyces haynaldii]|nr:hypothetical protein EDD86DRAFT_204243 [Gorgonomyces haynaldii]
MFEQPYDQFIAKLLQYAGHITKPHNYKLVEHCLVSAPKGSGWTIWLSESARQHFIDTKQALLPKSTHCQFVNVLLVLYMQSKRPQSPDELPFTLSIPPKVKTELAYISPPNSCVNSPDFTISTPDGLAGQAHYQPIKMIPIKPYNPMSIQNILND